MTFIHGKNAAILADQYNASRLFKSVEVSADKALSDVTCFGGDGWTESLAGTSSASAQLEGFYSDTRDAENWARISNENPSVVSVGMEGAAVGASAWLISAHSNSFKESSPVGDAVMTSWAITSTADVVKGVYLANPAVQFTDDTNGASFDFGAALTSRIWVLHVHLTAIDATSVVVKVQDSADNSSWADLTGATSGSLSAVGAIRVTGTGAVRRYVRISVDTTGGNGDCNVAATFGRTL